MKPSKPLAIIILTLALSGITASLAQAAATIPSILPEATAEKPITGTSKSAISVFGNGVLSVESKKSKGTWLLNSLKLGSFKIEFAEYENTLSGVKCNGLGLGTGLVNIEGTFHIRHYKEGSLKTAMILLLRPVHFECGALALLVWLGCIAGQLTPESVLSKTLTVTFAKVGSDNIPITVLREETGEEACQMLSAEKDSSTFKLSVITSVQLLENAEQGGKQVTVLVMPL